MNLQDLKLSQAYAASSPLTAFLAFVVFNSKTNSHDTANDESKKAIMNYWTGYILLVACGTLLYITLMDMLPEVFSKDEEEVCDSINTTKKDVVKSPRDIEKNRVKSPRDIEKNRVKSPRDIEKNKGHRGCEILDTI